jgi:uncharacterized protein (DUF1684 family)
MTDSTDPDDGNSYERRLNRKRAEKDEFFRTHRQSPIPPDKRDSFDGLAYFDPDTEYRVQADVTRFADPDDANISTSTTALTLIWRLRTTIRT